jgi:hypothetical protein
MQDTAGNSRTVIRSVMTSRNDSAGIAKIMADAGYPRIPVMGDRDFYQVERLRKRAGALQEAVKFGLSVIPFLPHIMPHIEKPDWADAEVLGLAREAMKKFGMTKSGWKYLLSMPPQRAWLLSNVPGGREGDSMRGIVRRVQALAEIGVWPKRMDAVERVFDRHLLDHEYEPEVRDTLLVICKRMWEHADTMPARSGKYREFLGHTMDVIDWFDQERPRFEKNQKNSSWETIHERVKAWHEELRQRQEREAAERLEALRRAQVATRSWGTLIDKFETDDGFEVIPLVTEIMLVSEGQGMGHCVGSYTSRCRSGHSRIFSIRKKGESKATLEIGAGSGGGEWRIQQIRGPKNQNVSDRLATIGNKVLTDWNKKRAKGEEEAFPQWANDPKYLGDLVDVNTAAPGP